MAASSSAAVATAHVFSSSTALGTSNPSRVISLSVKFPVMTISRRSVGFVIRSSSSSSSEVSAEETIQNGEEEVPESQEVEQAPEGPPSLISALNVEKALRGMAIADVDHYGRLGLTRGCSSAEVSVAYKNKVEQLINQQLPEEQLEANLQPLRESYSILSTVEERRLYDWSLSRVENPNGYTWPYEVDTTKTSTLPPPPQEAEDTGPTTMVGYFFFGWFILSVILSILLNR